MKAGRRKGPFKSDRERTDFWVKSGYFKVYGKRAGNRLERRTGSPRRICRETKHLPG